MKPSRGAYFFVTTAGAAAALLLPIGYAILLTWWLWPREWLRRPPALLDRERAIAAGKS